MVGDAASPSGANLTFETLIADRLVLKCQIESSTRINKLLVVPLIPTFACERAAAGCKYRNRTTSRRKRQECASQGDGWPAGFDFALPLSYR